jgi:hypothetical protein
MPRASYAPTIPVYVVCDQFPQDRLDKKVIYFSFLRYPDYGDFPQFTQFLQVSQLKGQVEAMH